MVHIFTDIQNNNKVNLILNDTSFWDITFDTFYSSHLTLVSNDAFGKSSLTIKKFMNWNDGFIKNSPPNYNVWKVISNFVNLEYGYFHLNVTEIPSEAFLPLNGKQSKLKTMEINIKNNFGDSFTIKRMAFYHLENISSMTFYGHIEKIESEAFAFNKKSNENLLLYFTVKNGGATFEPRSFDGIQRSVSLHLFGCDYLPDSSFKSLLIHPENQINFGDSINCLDCKNHWLIRDGKDNQVSNAICQHNKNFTLFNTQIKYQLNSKCKTKELN